jgi:uncharacterized membrane protein
MVVMLPMVGLAVDEPVVAEGTEQAVVEHHDGHESIGKRIAVGMRKLGWPDEAIIVAISTLPIVELRGAIPVGHVLMQHEEGEEPVGEKSRVAMAIKIYILAVLGNMIPIPFILLLLGPVSEILMKFKIGRVFFEWLFARTRRKTANVEKYESLGLTIFVAIPLPVTGGWTGAMAAFLMGIKFHHAMICILFGVMIAGVIMTVLSLMGWLGALVAGVVLLGLACSAILQVFKREQTK